MKSRVSLIDCADYDLDRVREALRECLAPLGGMEAFVRPGQRALLQVNLISPRPPEDAVCTHPSVVRAVCQLVREAGGTPAVGGSGGAAGLAYHRTRKILEVSGIAAAAAAEGAEVVNYDEVEGQAVANDDSPEHSMSLARPVKETDVLITLPKMKTHNLTLFTGAVKNHVGTLPGRRKLALHKHFADPRTFGAAVLDLYASAPPRLAIMDAVEGMEGDGPTAGRVRQVGLLAASADGVALDAVMCAVAGLDLEQVPTLTAARERGYGAAALDDVEVVGVPLATARGRLAPFAYPGSYRVSAQSWLPSWGWRFVTKVMSMSPTPHVMTDKCTGCQVCIKGCPAQTISLVNRKAHIDLSNCISCFCCHELCPSQAVEVKIPWHLRAFGGKEAAALAGR